MPASTKTFAELAVARWEGRDARFRKAKNSNWPLDFNSIDIAESGPVTPENFQRSLDEYLFRLYLDHSWVKLSKEEQRRAVNCAYEATIAAEGQLYFIIDPDHFGIDKGPKFAAFKRALHPYKKIGFLRLEITADRAAEESALLGALLSQLSGKDESRS